MTRQVHTIILDLDGTLIKTEKLKDAFKQIAVDYGCTSDEARDVYKDSRTSIDPESGKEKIFFSREHFAEVLRKFLREKKGIEVGEVDFKKLDTELNENLLLPGTKELLEKIKKSDVDFYLITLGAEIWQKEKIKGAGLDEYFNFGNEKREGNVIFTDDNEGNGGRKSGAIKEKFGDDFTGEGVLFLNDKPWETKNLSLEFKELQSFVVPDLDDERYDMEIFEKARIQAQEAGGSLVCLGGLDKFEEHLIKTGLIKEVSIDPERQNKLRK
ncbi:HAD family hydrolase [Patescibacteria group bacterium]|nr:HAD family hydrolase [Patescibacteria group bacterium]